MKISQLLSSFAAMLITIACSGNASTNAATSDSKQHERGQNKPSTQIDTSSKALVVFFSHAGDNYGVGRVKIGNTKIVADYISELTGADQFEIVTHKYDGMAYDPLCELAKDEQQKGELPPFEGSVDVSDYSTVFIGGPVWWGTYPQVMFTFFKQYDLNGKTLIPFTTHEGSRLGACVDDVKAAYPQANVLDGFSMYGHDVREGKSRVENWLNELGLLK